MKYSKSTTKWLDKIAKRNNTTREKVEEYIKSLSRTGKVIHHLVLSAAEGVFRP